MNSSLKHFRKNYWKKFYFVVALLFAIQLNIAPTMSLAGNVTGLPVPGTRLTVSEKYNPALMIGVKADPTNPLQFNFIINKGDTSLDGAALETESLRLIKYFLASLTIPEDQTWVNLSPYENDRVITEALGVTEMGKDMLAQDYMLKQLAASLTYPDDKIGQDFWQKVYEKAYQVYGTTNIPLNTFNKVWIVPENAYIEEKDGTAYVVYSHLRVMTEQDYLTMQKNSNNQKFGTQQLEPKKVAEVNEVTSDVVKNVIIPAIEKEINEGKNFAQVRQIYNSMILATWYKQRLKDSLISQVYVNKAKVSGVDIDDKKMKEKIYQQYLEAFGKGVYSLIKEDYDLSSNRKIPRKYFSGGMVAPRAEQILPVSSALIANRPEIRAGAEAVSSAIENEKVVEVTTITGEIPGDTAGRTIKSSSPVFSANATRNHPRTAEIMFRKIFNLMLTAAQKGTDLTDPLFQGQLRYSMKHLSKVAELLSGDVIHPEIVQLLEGPTTPESDQRLIDLLKRYKNVKIADYPISANPLTIAHEGNIEAVLSATKADATETIIAADDPRKTGAKALIPFQTRFQMAQAVASDYAGLVLASRIAEGKDLDGEYNIFKHAQKLSARLTRLKPILKSAGVTITLIYVVGADHIDWTVKDAKTGKDKMVNGLAVIRQASVEELMNMLTGIAVKEGVTLTKEEARDISKFLYSLKVELRAEELSDEALLRKQLDTKGLSPEIIDAVILKLQQEKIAQADTAKKLDDNINAKLFDFDPDLFKIELVIIPRIEEEMTPAQQEDYMQNYYTKIAELQNKVPYLIHTAEPYIISDVSATKIRSEQRFDLMPRSVQKIVYREGLFNFPVNKNFGQNELPADFDKRALQNPMTARFFQQWIYELGLTAAREGASLTDQFYQEQIRLTSQHLGNLAELINQELIHPDIVPTLLHPPTQFFDREALRKLTEQNGARLAFFPIAANPPTIAIQDNAFSVMSATQASGLFLPVAGSDPRRTGKTALLPFDNRLAMANALAANAKGLIFVSDVARDHDHDGETVIFEFAQQLSTRLNRITPQLRKGVARKEVFEKAGFVNLEVLIPSLIKKGYLEEDQRVSPEFKELDTEFRGWFPNFTAAQFTQLTNLLEKAKDNTTKITLIYVVGSNHINWTLPDKIHKGLAVIRQASVSELKKMLAGLKVEEKVVEEATIAGIAKYLYNLKIELSANELSDEQILRNRLRTQFPPTLDKPENAALINAIIARLKTQKIEEADTAKKLVDNIEAGIFNFDSKLFNIELVIIPRMTEQLTAAEQVAFLKTYREQISTLRKKVPFSIFEHEIQPYAISEVSEERILTGHEANLMPFRVAEIATDFGLVVKNGAKPAKGSSPVNANLEQKKQFEKFQQWLTSAEAKNIIKNPDEISAAEIARATGIAEPDIFQFLAAAGAEFVPPDKWAAPAGSQLRETLTSSPVAGTKNVGGIDFNPAYLSLKIKRDGRGIPLPMPMQDVNQMNIRGLYPVIINITPVTPPPFQFLLGGPAMGTAEGLKLSSN